MTVYIIRRLLSLIPLLIGITIVTFASVRLAPGDPVEQILNENANAEAAERLRAYLGLDQPLPVQFGRYMANLFQGDLGRSLLTNAPVADEIGSRFPATLELALASMVVATGFGIPLGVLAAVARRRWV